MFQNLIAKVALFSIVVQLFLPFIGGGVFTSYASVDATYDFNSDIVGSTPADVTPANGTIRAQSYSGATDIGMEALTSSSGQTHISLMDSIPSATDYSITWRETYTSPRRSGFVLRASGENSINPGGGQGYLFQVSTTNPRDMRIYTSDASGHTKISDVNIAPQGVNTPRWYRATASGTTLTFEYSDDGTIFLPAGSVVDSTYSSGTTEYTMGFGQGQGGLFVDDIEFDNFGTLTPPSATGSISITNLDEYQVIQRTGTGADIVVSGTYSGTPTSIEASFNGGTFEVIDASPSGGTFSGTLLNQHQGQGTLTVRHSNDTSFSGSVGNIGIGDIFIISGQSNASGRGDTTNNTYSHPTLKATLFGNDDTWKNLVDPVDSSAGQIDSVSGDSGAKGTPWTQVATAIMAAEGVPVAFIPTAKGGTRTSAWQPGGGLYTSLERRINEVGGSAKANLWFQGESDSTNGTTEATYETELGIIVDSISTDFGGLKTIVGQIGHSNFSGNDTIRKAQVDVINANTNALAGPLTYDIDLSDGAGADTLHFKADDDMDEFAARWYAAIDATIYGGADGYGPIIDSANLEYDSGSNTITVPFNETLSGSSTVTSDSFDLNNNGSSVAISGVTISGNNVEITPAIPLNTSQSMTLSYASLNDAVNEAIYDVNSLPAEPFYDEAITLATAIPAIAPGGVSTDLALWLKANEETASDDADIISVENFADGSNGTGTGHAPSFQNDATNNINFNPVYSFDGSPDGNSFGNHFEFSSLLGSSTYNEATVYTVQNVQGAAGGGSFGEDIAATNDNSRFMVHNPLGATTFWLANSSSSSSPWETYKASPILQGRSVLHTFGASATSGEDKYIREDGIQIDDRAHADVTFTGNNSPFYIGCGVSDGAATPGWCANSNIAETIVYLGGSGLDALERQQIESYLAVKYGITLDATIGSYKDSTGSDVYTMADTEIFDFSFGSTNNGGGGSGTSGIGGAANTFTLSEPSTVTITHSGTINTSNAGIGISTSVLPNAANTIAVASPYNTNGDRIDAVTPVKSYTTTLAAGTYFVGVFSGGGGSVDGHDVNIRAVGIASYENDIIGIAKDDVQTLDQRISQSVNSGSILTVSTDTDFTSANTTHADTLTDGQYLVIGNNGSGTTAQTTELATALYQDRLSREWRVENTKSVGTVNLSFDGFDDDYVLLTDSDGDFSNGATNEGTLSASGAIALTLDDGEFFTLARPATPLTKGLYFYPGGELDFTQRSTSVEMTNIDRRASSLSIIQTFNNDGTKMFIANEGVSSTLSTEDLDGRVSEYSLGVPYDVSTQSFVERHNIYPNLTTVPGTTGDSRIIRDISFSPDGLKLFVLNHNNSSKIHLQEYALTAPFDLSTLAVGHVSSRDLSDLGSCDSNFRRAFQWANGGTKLYATGDSDICQFTTTIPYSVAGLSYETRLNASSFVYNSVYVSEDGKRLFTSEGNDGDNSDVLYYTLDTPFDISTTRFIATIDTADIGATESSFYGYRFRANPGETKLYLNPSINVNSPFEIREFTLKPDNLRESDANDGSIDNSDPLLIRLIGEAFSDGNNDDILDPASYRVNNLPVGLTAVLTLSESDTAATLSLSGSATDHSWDDDVDEITFEFTDAAFAGGDAGAVFHSGDGSPVSVGLGVGIDFGDTPAGVNSNLRLWLNPDYGVNDDKSCDGTLPADGTDTDCWQDLSLNSFTAIQDSGTNPVPNYIANSTNFNPGFSFNGSDEYWSVENVAGTNLGILREETFADAHVYAVFTAEDNNNTLFNEDTGEDDFGFFPYFSGGSDRHFWYAGDSGGSDDERLQVDTAGVGVGEPALMTLNSRTSSNVGQAIRRNGIDLITDTTADTIKGIDDELNIGVEQGGSDYLEGTINELIIFTGTGVHDAANEQQKIESYLAVKYGITLDTSSNDYVDSAGSSVYTLTGATSAYSNDVFGIARDDISLLDQRISSSVNSGSILTISTDTDFTSANATHTGTLTDGQYLMIGHNGGNTATGTTDLDTAIYDSRVNREWRVENTSSVGTINLSFDGFNDDYVLLTDSDGNFSSGTTNEGTLSASGAIALTLGDGEFFTLAIVSSEAPGGVSANLDFWVKADADLIADGSNTLNDWTDQVNNATGSINGTPTLIANGLNFNPWVEFDPGTGTGAANASTDWIDWDNFTSAYTQGQAYIVMEHDNDPAAGQFHGAFWDLGAETVLWDDGRIFEAFGDLAGGTARSIFNPVKPFDEPLIYSAGIDDSVNSVRTIRIDGTQVNTNNNSNVNFGTDPVSLGRTNFNPALPGNRGFGGRIAEFIVFSDDQKNSSEQQIESYLALKYGITLSGTGYLNTLGSTVYDLTTGYDSDVFGVAKDDAQELDQRISKSVNSGSILTVSTDTDFTSANTTHADTLTDGQYLVIGNNGGATATQTTAVQSRVGVYNAVLENESGIVTLDSNSFGGTTSFVDFASWTADRDGTIDSISWLHQKLITAGSIAQFRITNDTTGDTQTVSFNPGTVISEPVGTTGVANRTFAPIAISTGDSIRIEGADNNANDWGFGTVESDDFNWLLGGHTGNPGFSLSGPLPGSVIPIEREWRVENTNSVGNVNLSFDGFDDDYVLLTDSDGDFSFGAISQGVLSASGAIALILDDGQFFTLAALDTTAPTVTFNQASTQSDPETGTGVVNFIATFSEQIDVASFTCSDISTSGTATATCTSITEISGGNVFNIEITATTAGEVLTLILPGVVTDLAGNENTLSNSTDNSVTIALGVFDTTPPVVPTVDLPSNFDPLTGTGEPGSIVTIFSSTGTVIGTGTVSGSGTFSITPDPIPTTGPVTFTTTDSAGNTSTGASIGTGSIDTTPPVVPTADLPSNFNPFTGTGEPGSVVTIFSSTGAVIGTGTVSGSGTFSITPDPIPTTGPVTFTTTDLAGNTSTGATIGTGSIDTTAPSAPTVNTPTNFNPLTGTGEVGAEVSIFSSTGTLIGTGVVDGSGEFSIVIAPAPTVEPITVNQKDSAGNISPDATILTAGGGSGGGGIDTTVPITPAINTPTNFSPLTGTGEVGTIIKVFNASNIVIGTGVVDSDGLFSVTPNPIPTNGPINVTSTDIAGNESTPKTISTEDIDTTPPVVPTADVPSNFDPLTGTGEPGSVVTIFSSTGAVIGTGTVTGSGTFSITPDPIPTTGPVTFTTTDSAGNTSTGASIGTGSIDTTSPVITITESGVVTHIVNNIYIDAGATCTDDVDVTCNTTASGVVDGFTLGVYTIDYNTTDTAGNNAITQTRTINVIDSLADTDGDSVPDVIEIEQGTSPTNSGSFLDTDGDSAPDFVDPDDDGDGSIDSIEAGAPNGGDFNNDGLVDVLQQDVATIVSPINSEYVALDTTSGSCASASFNMVAESSLSTQSEREFPLGLADFSLNCSSTGATANIKVYYDRVYDTSTWEYQKYNATLNTYSDISSIVSYTTETVGSGSVTVANYSITDGGDHDEDGVANGVIVDPSGPTIPVVVQQVGGGSSPSACRDPEALNYSRFGRSNPDLCEYSDNIISIIPELSIDSEESSIANKDENTNGVELSDQETDNREQSEQNAQENDGEDIQENNEQEVRDEDRVLNLSRDYILENNFDSCDIVGAVKDSNYPYATSGVFIDEDASNYKQELLKFAEIGIINGYDDGTFAPQNTITRTEFLKIVLQTHCLEYSDVLSEDLDYIDVDASSWQVRVISKAKELEIINGDVLEIDRDLIDTNLGRQYSLDRVTELQRVFSVLGLYEGDIDGYYDDEFIDAVYDFQVAQGIMSSPYDTGAGFWGEQTRGVFFELYPEESYPIFRPNDTISKVEAIKILFNLSNIEAIDSLPLSYTDITVGWHEKYVQTGEALGLFDSQKDNGVFSPESGVKREEMIDLVNRLIQLY